MDPKDNRSNKNTFARLAARSGLAISVIDDRGREIQVANNNSICRKLNPAGVMTPPCTEYCGKALEHVTRTGKIAAFECHAGLECCAVPVNDPNTPLVAIVGRTFVKAENYRKATERAISGDWSKYSPSEFFENVLLASSNEVLRATAHEVDALIKQARARRAARPTELAADERPIERPQFIDLSPETSAGPKPTKEIPQAASNLVEKFNREIRLEPAAPPTTRAPDPPEPQQEDGDSTADGGDDTEFARRTGQAWRSFFGSILQTNYAKARDSLLEFIAVEYGLSSLIWLERKVDKFESSTGYGSLKDRRLRLGIAANDARLLAALASDEPLELGERGGTEKNGRTMTMFPIGVGGQISSAIAVLGRLADDARHQIARTCHTIAPQLEILRLRSEIAHTEAIASAVAKFGSSLRQIDTEDFWIRLVQNAAEIVRSERSSLLIYDDVNERLEVKAVVGVKEWTKDESEIGGRVAQYVVAKHSALVVPDVTKTRLPPADPARRYRTDSFMSCPVSIGDRLIGVMNFTDKASGGTFDESSLELYQAFAPQLAVAVDRASLKSKAGEFEQLSVTDALTGLLNRRYIEARLSEEIKRSNRHGFPMSFMMLDVDNFKSYNDNFGHPA
ncbi:MAG: diguanylate cyclase, partial [Pyrinomonadaceae bacterium]